VLLDETTCAPPTARVAMVGGGQLARMTHRAAIDYGIDLHVLATSTEDPAVTAGANYTLGPADDATLLRQLAAGADVVTFDHELVPLDVLSSMAEQGSVIRPGAQALMLGCDKLFARAALSDLGELSIPVPAFVSVFSTSDVTAFAGKHGWPVVLKARSGGYDGRGVVIVGNEAEAREVLSGHQPGEEARWVVEEHLDIVAEFAILTARSPSGMMATYPPIGTLQVDGICRELVIPADLPEEIVRQGALWARSVIQGFDATGIVAVEFFVTRDGRLLLNEFALRPHNSGHITFEACATSQFHQHLRAILDWPLGETALVRPAATVNLIADSSTMDIAACLPHALAVKDVYVHLYQKAPRPGRKIGHVTALADSTTEALELAREATRRFFP